MWKCSKCKVYWDLGSNCTKCGQLSRDDLIVQVKKEDLFQNEFNHLESMREVSEQQKQPPQYWECPEHYKIMRTDQVCPQCLWRIDQQATKYGQSQQQLLINKRQVVVQEINKIEPGKWHCDNCDRNISVNKFCKECGFYQNGFKKQNCWRCPNCKLLNDDDRKVCKNNKCNQTKKQHMQNDVFTLWKCTKDNELVEKGSACYKCSKTKEQYDNLKAKQTQKVKQIQVFRDPQEFWVCYCCGNDQNPGKHIKCENPSCYNKFGSDYFTEFWMCFECNNKNEVDDWINDVVAECQNYNCRYKSTTIQGLIERHKNARLSKCKNCTKKHYPQNAKDYCRPCLWSHFKCGCKYGCSQCEGYAYTRCEKCTQFKCRKGAKICRECTEIKEVFGTCQICQMCDLKNGQCQYGCQQQERNKQCSMCHRYFKGKPGELCFVCRPRNQVRNSTATYYNCGKCGVHRSEPGYCNKCKPSKTIFQQIGDFLF